MSDEKPLRVRCAEGLGCKPRLCESDAHHAKNPAPWSCRCVANKHGDDSGHLLPYGEDSPEGWACTGPLIGRFDLRVERSRIDLRGKGKWFASKNERADGLWIIGPDAPHACAAVAEWVVQHGQSASTPREGLKDIARLIGPDIEGITAADIAALRE